MKQEDIRNTLHLKSQRGNILSLSSQCWPELFNFESLCSCSKPLSNTTMLYCDISDSSPHPFLYKNIIYFPGCNIQYICNRNIYISLQRRKYTKEVKDLAAEGIVEEFSLGQKMTHTGLTWNAPLFHTVLPCGDTRPDPD